MKESIYKKLDAINDEDSLFESNNTPVKSTTDIEEVYKELKYIVWHYYINHIELIQKDVEFLYSRDCYQNVVEEATQRSLVVIPKTATLDYTTQGSCGIGEIVLDSGDVITWDFNEEVRSSIEAINNCKTFDEFVKWYSDFYSKKIKEYTTTSDKV